MTSPNDFLPADYKKPYDYAYWGRLKAGVNVLKASFESRLTYSPELARCITKLSEIYSLVLEAEEKQQKENECKQLTLPWDASNNIDLTQVDLTITRPTNPKEVAAKNDEIMKEISRVMLKRIQDRLDPSDAS